MINFNYVMRVEEIAALILILIVITKTISDIINCLWVIFNNIIV